MLSRFLIVILVILNVGVALWWMVPRADTAAAPAKPELGVATLELMPSPAASAAPAATGDAVPAVTPAAAVAAPAVARPEDAEPAASTPAPAKPTEAKPAEAVPPVAATPKPVEHCASLGPFTDAAKAQAAQAALGADAQRPRVREVPGKSGSGSYRVFIPPAASREEAQATAKRIVEAGFSDYFVVSQGEEANAVALGQYRNREGAERRLATLVAAGFPARLAGGGNETPPTWWLDVASSSASPATLMQRAGAAQQQSLDCARLR
ncbi:MAG: SPOR domain-containing protein [Stenotrophomonas sp.]